MLKWKFLFLFIIRDESFFIKMSNMLDINSIPVWKSIKFFPSGIIKIAEIFIRIPALNVKIK